MLDALILGLRGVAVGLALALVLAGAGLPRRARLALVPVLVCLAAYLLRSAPQAWSWPGAALVPLAVGALMFPLSFWWLVHSVFDDRADLPWIAWVAAAAMLAAGFLSSPIRAAALSLSADGPHLVQKVVAAGFVLAGLWRLWRGGAEDLVVGRRVLRGWLLAYIGLHGLTILGVELWLCRRPAPPWLDGVNVAVIGTGLSVALVLLTAFRTNAVEILFGAVPDATRHEPVPVPESAKPKPTSDAPWVERVQRLMTIELAYRDPELSIGRLAERVSLPEYRLRELIHDRLGFRNFSAFINEYRLREVERQLADPACDRRPILTLALEAGFGSIGPFNRAFRERHGMTPTAFRSQRGPATRAAQT
jgi:AraC-like DNA-binding protein